MRARARHSTERARLEQGLWRDRRGETLVMAAALLLATSSATRISLGTRTLNASRLGLPSTLPVFGGYSGSAASPIVPPLNASLACSDSCPDDIIKHQIQISAPTLPYRSFDDYDCGGTCGRARVPGVQRTIPTILYESDAYRATLYPDRGGKLASLYHKPTGRELLFDNPVWQPGRLGRLNAWTSGGIEWNWPRHGHTVFHMQPLWAVEVATSRGPVLRLFEFDREMNTTFQVDLWAAADAASAKEHDAPFYAHVKLTNPNDHDVDGYWWTNMAVPLAATSRVAYTDGTYAVVSGGSDGLALVPFPHFSETPSTMSPAAHANPLFNAVDHSYPAAYYTARENFIRPNNNGTTPALARALMGIVDTTSGKGALHAQSSELGGRKFWAWGNDWNDVGRMDFLSACPGPTDGSCEGAYLEMQAGVALTQMQTFPLGARSSLEWTEAWSAWRAPPASVRSSYDEAVERARADFPATKAQFGEVRDPIAIPNSLCSLLPRSCCYPRPYLAQRPRSCAPPTTSFPSQHRWIDGCGPSLSYPRAGSCGAAPLTAACTSCSPSSSSRPRCRLTRLICGCLSGGRGTSCLHKALSPMPR